MWVKVCGTTTAEDARLAVEAGADAVGFVMARVSRRHVGVAEVRAILDAVRGEGAPVEWVGVVDPEDYVAEGGVGRDGHVMGGTDGVWSANDLAGVLAEDAEAAGLETVQLHGATGRLGFSQVELVTALRVLSPKLRIVPVVNWEVGQEGSGERVRRTMDGLRRAGVTRVLVDSKVGAAAGGTGVPFAWETAAQVLNGVRDGMELVVAGGLRPETVAEAVRVLRPWGVDVVSGVEAEAGRKDAERVRSFVRAARG